MSLLKLPSFQWRSLPWRPLLLAAVAGALLPLSFAPFDLWPVAIASVLCLCLLLYRSSGSSAFWRSLVFGLGMYGTGASWVFVSIYQFGNVAPAFALFLTGLFVLVLASIFALPFAVLGRWFANRPFTLLLAFPALWLIGEWLRSWLFTGFPWLYLGYGHLDSWLAGWAPVLGVMGISLIVAASAAALAHAVILLRAGERRPLAALLPLLLLAVLWPAGSVLRDVEWTEARPETLSVGMVQGNIPQELKWDPGFLQPTLERYFTMSETLWDNDWVIWPEAAMPLLYHRALPFIEELKKIALMHEAALITGVLYDSRERYAYYNSVIAIGTGSGIYHKQRLVPFGDYVPLRDWFGPLLSLFNLPMSVLEPGPPDQRGLQVADAMLAPSICYEIAYPDVVASGAINAEILITISNDAWFGASIGPLQHMQIAQMRALETDRYLIRATNNGVSALVDNKGRITGRTDRFVQQTLEGEVQLRSGLTPYMRWGTEPLVAFALVLMAIATGLRRRTGA